MRLVFVRHAQSVANAKGRWQGRLEFDLSPEGREQARRLSNRFQEESFQPTHIYSSPQKRTAETAKVVGRAWSVPIEFWDDLKEIDVGAFSGLTWDEIADKYPGVAEEFQRMRRWSVVPGAEPVQERIARARRVIRAVVHRHSDNDTLLIITHGGILLHMLKALMDTGRTWGMTIRNTAVFDFALDIERWWVDGEIRHNPTLWRIHRFNDASHLIASPPPL